MGIITLIRLKAFFILVLLSLGSVTGEDASSATNTTKALSDNSTTSATTTPNPTKVTSPAPLPVIVGSNPTSTPEPVTSPNKTDTTTGNDHANATTTTTTTTTEKVTTGATSEVTTTTEIPSTTKPVPVKKNSKPIVYLEIASIVFVLLFVCFVIMKTWSIYYSEKVLTCCFFDVLLNALSIVFVCIWKLLKICASKLCCCKSASSFGYKRSFDSTNNLADMELLNEESYPLDGCKL